MNLNNRIERSIHAYYNDSEFQNEFNSNYSNFLDLPNSESQIPLNSPIAQVIANNYTYFTQTEELIISKLPRLQGLLNDSFQSKDFIDEAHAISNFVETSYKSGLVTELIQTQIDKVSNKRSELESNFKKLLPDDIERRLKDNISQKSKQINFLESHYIQSVDTCLELNGYIGQFSKHPLMVGETPNSMKKISANKLSVVPYKDIRLKSVSDDKIQYNKTFNKTSGLLMDQKQHVMLFPSKIDDVFENRQLSFQDLHPTLNSGYSSYASQVDTLSNVSVEINESIISNTPKQFNKPIVKVSNDFNSDSEQLEMFPEI